MRQRNTIISYAARRRLESTWIPKEESACPHIDRSFGQTVGSDGIPEPLDPLDGRDLALVESSVESAVEHGQDADQDDRKELGADRRP
jgi:hypothetical protein